MQCRLSKHCLSKLLTMLASSLRIVLVVLLCFLKQTCYAGQLCASCTDTAGPFACHHYIECADEEECFMHQYIKESGSSSFDFGCIVSQACPQYTGQIIGKRSEGHHIKCYSCCNGTRFCNLIAPCHTAPSVITTPGTTLPRDCSEITDPSSKRNGSHTIYPFGVQTKPANVYCEFDANGTAWTVIQRRYNGSVNFYRNWADYKRGFGSSYGEYWIGNDILHQLTAYHTQKLKIVLTDFENITKHADYDTFYVGDEGSGYLLTIGGYSGDAGDAMHARSNNMKFSTFDRENDVHPNDNCARKYKGAWWYRDCHYANLNGQYLHGHHVTNADGIEWEPWHGFHYSLKYAKMMIQQWKYKH